MRRLREEAVGEVRAQVLARGFRRDLSAKPLVERDRVELPRPRVLPRRLRVELLGERVELGVALVQGTRVGPGQRALAVRVPPRLPVRVDVDVVSVAVGGKEADAELLEQRVHARLVRRDPLPAELVRLAAELGVPQASADPVASLEHDDLAAFSDEPACSRETGNTRADDGDVRFYAAGAHASVPSAAAAAERPVRTAPSM